MKVKIFKIESSVQIEDVQTQINEFIQDKKLIDIKQSECTGEKWSLTLTVIYEDIEESIYYQREIKTL